MNKEKPYEIWHDGKPLTELMPNDLLILLNIGTDPNLAEILSQTRVLFLSSEVKAIVVRDWENKHNVGIDPKAVESLLIKSQEEIRKNFSRNKSNKIRPPLQPVLDNSYQHHDYSA